MILDPKELLAREQRSLGRKLGLVNAQLVAGGGYEIMLIVYRCAPYAHPAARDLPPEIRWAVYTSRGTSGAQMAGGGILGPEPDLRRVGG